MSKFAIRLLTLSMCATALVVVPMVTPAKAETSSSKHIKKHRKNIQRSPGIRDSLVCRSGVACYRAIQSGRRGLPRHRPKLRV
jgi:hypothetical protein